MINIVETLKTKTKIKVMGVGGAGGKSLNTMIPAEIEGVEYVAVNTDAQALGCCTAREKIQIGKNITDGLGAGGSPEKGKCAVEEDIELIKEALEDVRILFLTAGFGGGTGTGAAPVIAREAREQGLLTIAIVTKPFEFEGSFKMRVAEEGVRELKNAIDTVMIIPNQRLFEIAGDDMTMVDAFQQTDTTLTRSVQAISRLILKPGMINLDFAHIQAVMSIKGSAMLGFGEGEGQGKAVHAMKEAISSPLIEAKELKGARGVLISLVCGEDLMLTELNQAVEIVKQIAEPDANIIFGANIEPEMEGRAAITLIATGFESAGEKKNAALGKAIIKEKNDRVIDMFAEDPKKSGQSSLLIRGEQLIYRGENLEKPAFWRKKKEAKTTVFKD